MRGLVSKTVALAAIATLSGSAGAAPTQADAAWSAGPRVFFVGIDFERLRIELLSASPSGKKVRRVAGGGFLGTVRPPFPEVAPPSWSADGNLMAFIGLRKDSTRVFLTTGGDRAPRPLPGTRGANFVALSPDAGTVAFSRTNTSRPATSTWLYDRVVKTTRRLTPPRPGLHMMPGTFSPDGAHLAVSAHDPRRGYRALSIDLATGKRRVLARRATFPSISPDGSKLAYISFRDRQRQAGASSPAGELYVRRLPGGKQMRLTRTERQSETTPAWDPSGERIAYAQAAGPLSFLGLSGLLMQINADGSCRRALYAQQRADSFETYLSPAWQPGPGRGAGRIAC